MFFLFPLLIFAFSLFVIIFLFIKKFSQLVLLDVNTIPEVKVNKQKNRIFRKRIEERSREVNKKWLGRIIPIIQKLKEIQLSFRKYVGNIQRRAIDVTKKKSAEETPEEKIKRENDVRFATQEGNQALEENNLEMAEKSFISAIKLDQKNIDAYRGLAKVYYKQNQIGEATETFKFILQLDPKNEEALVTLAEMSENKNDWNGAVNYYQEAVLVNPYNPGRFVKLFELLEKLNQHETALEAIEQALNLEPQNPKYLDKLVEVSIILSNKTLAEEGYERLRMVNPENQKLESFRQRIDALN